LIILQAYQVLHRGGVPDERIIVMMYDDIAGNPANPRPGQLINHPTGQDNYVGMPKDYTADAVTAENFLAVLSGNSSAIRASRNANGRVVEAGPTDRIFVFYSDHGAPGILGMPSGDFLYADKLHKVIKHRAKSREFGEMVLYIEACESGSIFEGLLEDDLNVYATTAANGQESSWGTYCPGMDPGAPMEFMTCLGDLYSVSWMEDADQNDLTHETLKKQYQRVKQRTSQNFTYNQGSHVQRFGELELDEEEASRFLGDENTGPVQPTVVWNAAAHVGDVHGTYNVPQREADLLPLKLAAAKELAGDYSGMPLASPGLTARDQLRFEIERRTALDASVLETVIILSKSTGLLSALDPLAIMERPVPAPKGRALVSDWDCLRAMVSEWTTACGPLDQYGMKHSRAFANLCNLGVDPQLFASAASLACSGGKEAIMTPTASF